jgi:hypothetical protein
MLFQAHIILRADTNSLMQDDDEMPELEEADKPADKSSKIQEVS